MTPEERFERIERQIEFIVNQQAQFHTDLRHLGGNVDRLAGVVEGVLGIVGDLAEAQKRTEERLNSLAEAQKRTEERLNSLAEAQKSLTDAQKQTDERLNILINVVERYFSNGNRS